mgnify:CR=1 FL=1
MTTNPATRPFGVFAGSGLDVKIGYTNQNLEESIMSIVVNIYYSGENGSARKFAKEMISSGTVDAIRNEAGNIRYDYFFPLGDEETVLLIDSWENQESIDFHHQSPMMNKIAELRDKYNLHMKVERYRLEDTIPDTDQKYIRN